MSEQLHSIDEPVADVLSRLDANVSEIRYDAHMFGNYRIIADLCGLGLRITRDRSQYFLDLRSNTHQHWIAYDQISNRSADVLQKADDLIRVIESIAHNTTGWKKRLDVLSE